IAFSLVFLYLPIITLVVFSFNDSRRNIVWNGFTFDYYVAAANNTSLIQAFFNSLTIAIVTTIASTILGGMVALALYRFRFPGKPAYDGISALPIVIPEICLGVALMVFFSRIGWFDYARSAPWPINLSAITASHIAFSFPFVTVVVR